MKDKTYLRALLDYNAWANAEIFRAAGALPAAEVAKERPSFLRSILVTLNHLVVADLIWKAHLEGRAHGFEHLQTVIHQDLEDLRQARRETDEWFGRYLDGLAPEALEETVAYELIGGNAGSMSRAMILTHIAIHGSYHRGWIADMMGQVPEDIKVPPPATDLPVYERAIRERGPARLP